jgi:protein subunit release factor B
MVTFAVSAEKNRQLVELMALAGLKEEDLEERFVRSSGAGGQHVNKTATCVHLRHIPTGIEVKCMRDRSQSINRFLARRELAEQLAAVAGVATKKSAAEEKSRRQKATRRRKARKKYSSTSLPQDTTHDKQ